MELMLETERLSCGYGSKTILSEVSFSLRAGEVLCILGPNGVGKTTLFKTILGLLRCQGGSVKVCGKALASANRGSTPDGIAYVPQAHFPAFSYPVRDIVVMGRTRQMKAFATPSKADYEAALHVLGRLGLQALFDRDYTQISGGERQMVLIARALVQEPSVLIMDEPAASLDYGNQARLLRQIRQLSKERSMGILMTTHNPDHAFICASHVLMIMPDRSFVAGTSEQVLTDENLSKAYGTQIRILESRESDGTLLKSCVPKL